MKFVRFKNLLKRIVILPPTDEPDNFIETKKRTLLIKIDGYMIY